MLSRQDGSAPSRTVALAAATLLAWLASAPASPAMTLQEALVEAYQTNPDLAAGRAGLRATDTAMTRARAGYLPTIKGTAQYQMQRGNQRLDLDELSGGQPIDPASEALFGLVEDMDANTTTYQLTLDQNLYQGGATKAGISRAMNQIRAGRSGLVVTEQSVLLDAVSAYVDVWRGRASVTESEDNVQRLAERLRKTRRVYELGEVTLTDVRQAEASLARGEADLDEERANLADAEATFRRVIGRDPDRLAAPEWMPDLPATLAEASARAEGAPEIQQARFDLAGAEDDVDVSFADLLPSVDLSGQLNHQENLNIFTEKMESASIGVKLTVPFFQGGTSMAKLRESRETVEQRRNQLVSQIRSAQEKAQKAWDQLRIAKARVRSYDAEIAANRLALEGVEREAQLGRRTTLDILDAQEDLHSSRLNMLRARSDMLVAAFQMKQSVGELTVEGLDLQVARYDPEANYRDERRRLFGIALPD